MTKNNFKEAIKITEKIKKYNNILKDIDASTNILLGFGANIEVEAKYEIIDRNVIDYIRNVIYEKIVKLEEQFRFI